MVSAKGTFVFITGKTGCVAGGGVKTSKATDETLKPTKKRAVVAVWNGRKRSMMHPGGGGGGEEIQPTRLLTGHGGEIRSLHSPDNPGDVAAER